MAQNRWHVIRYCLRAIIVTDMLLHLQFGWPTTGAAFAAELTRAPSGAVIINPNNPASATTFTWGDANWQFQAGTDDGFGNLHLIRNGVGTEYLFQVAFEGSNLYGYNLKTTTWYRWSGSSWSQIGSAPPFVSGKAVPFLLGASCCSGHGPELPWRRWLGRIPDYDDNGTGNGTFAYWTPGVNLGGGTLPMDLAYAMVGTDANGDCTDPNGATYSNLDTVMQAIAAGNYDQTINYEIQTYLVPVANLIYYIRISHEWPGNWYCDSPWYGGSEQSPNVPSSHWIAAWRHVHNLLKAKLPNVKYEWDGPSDATQAAYYPLSVVPETRPCGIGQEQWCKRCPVSWADGPKTGMAEIQPKPTPRGALRGFDSSAEAAVRNGRDS